MATEGLQHVGRRLSPQPERRWWVRDRLQQRRIRRHTAPEPANVHVPADSGRRPVGERLGEMFRRDRVHLGERRDGTCDAHRTGLGRVRRVVRVPPRDPATRTLPRFAEGHLHHGVALGRPRPVLGRGAEGFGRRCSQLRRPRSRHRNDEVEAVEQCSRHLLAIRGDPLRAAATVGSRVTPASARAQVHRRDEAKAGREERLPADPGDRHDAVLERLPERLEDRSRELGSSSRRRTPRCARLASPGRGVAPPPTMAAAEAP